ncbi:unnamed protein product, partial [Prorocentrum cordatum]
SRARTAGRSRDNSYQLHGELAGFARRAEQAHVRRAGTAPSSTGWPRRCQHSLVAVFSPDSVSPRWNILEEESKRSRCNCFRERSRTDGEQGNVVDDDGDDDDDADV